MTDFKLDRANGALVIAPTGEWTVWTLPAVLERLGEEMAAASAGGEREVRLDLAGLGRIDLAGAYALSTLKDGPFEPEEIDGGAPEARRLIATACSLEKDEPPAPVRRMGVTELFERTGRGVEEFGRDAVEVLSFLGQTLTVIGRLLARPWDLRWTSLFHFMEETGVNAIPIVATLSFFVGAVIAFIGATLLGQQGFQVYTVELVGFSVLREFGVVIMAILMAGRSDSAFTAQIGAMKMREEVDALEVMGVDPMEVLVAPRVIAIVLMSPMLCFVAIASGLVGGALACWAFVGISPQFFMDRMAANVGLQHFWVGMVKAPVFAFLVAITGCRHGLLVGGDVQSLGRRTTQSVVESIFLVIVADALFALLFLELDI